MGVYIGIGAMGLVLYVAAMVCMYYFTAKDVKRCRVSIKVTTMDDAFTLRKMMVDFLGDKIRDAGRRSDECKEAGCDGCFSLRESRDIARAVRIAHEVGGRLVLRKRGDCDVETASNTPDEVKRILSDMDIARAKRMEAEGRRRQ